MYGDTRASIIYCVSLQKLKKLVRLCELRRSPHVSVFTIENVLSVSHTCKILLLCLLCISLDSWGFSRGFAQCLALFIKIGDLFGCGYSVKENKRLIWLMMNYSVLLNTAFCFCNSCTMSYPRHELNNLGPLRRRLRSCKHFSWTSLLQIKEKHFSMIHFIM